MAPASDDMADLDRPVTLRELRSELQTTKLELEAGLAAVLTEIRTGNEALRTEMADGFAEMRACVDFSVKSLRDELKSHADLIAESLHTDFRDMFDWMKANMAS